MNKEEWIQKHLTLLVKQGKITPSRNYNWWRKRLSQSFDDLPKEIEQPSVPKEEHEFISKKIFVDALYNLTNGEDIVKVVQDKEVMKDFLYGFGLFSTELAPNNFFDLLDKHTAFFLEKLNLTVEEVRAEIKRIEGLQNENSRENLQASFPSADC